VLAVCERMIWQHSSQGIVPGPEGNHHPFLTPFGMFPAADGHVTIAAQTDAFYDILCGALDAPQLKADPRFATRGARGANKAAFVEALSAVTAGFTKAELAARLGGRIPFGPVLAIDEIEADAHFAARQMIAEVEQPHGGTLRIAGVPIQLSANPGAVRRRAPLVGEDTRARLRDAGLSDAEINDLIERRAAAASPDLPKESAS
jgi:crotonobetainyl-CoA:carnitine CoA-transferase CaiB-like acyl-CoA transferase